jgi:DNA-binding response OmpR family regulator
LGTILDGVANTTPQTSDALAGEDLQTTHWEDARHWIGVYADLIRFKVGLLERVRRELPKLQAVAQEAAAADLAIIEGQMRGYQGRLDLWYHRLWELHGLELDAEAQVIRHRGREGHLTRREFQLVQFLLDHPHRFFTVNQLLTRAWADPALFPEEVRNYVRRIRKILAELDIPGELVNRPSRGYSLVFRPDD